MTPLLEARGVAAIVDGRTLLHPIDLAVRAGETVVIVGPNGAGKLTLLALLSGERAPSAGRVLYDGRDARAWPAWRLLVVQPGDTVRFLPTDPGHNSVSHDDMPARPRPSAPRAL